MDQGCYICYKIGGDCGRHYGTPVPSNLKVDIILPESKETNPKDAVGVAKAPMSTVPTQVIAELGIAMMEGARKYGRSNYRIAGCRSSVYYDAAMRHLMAWWEGQDIDPDSGLSHVSKAIASLAVLRDCQINGNAVDDRPPSVANKEGWVASLNGLAKNLIEKYPEPKEAFTIKK